MYRSTDARGLACWLLQSAIAGAVTPAQAPPPPAPPPVTFTEVAVENGLRFQHFAGRTPDKNMIETLGSGACFLDYDGDGLPDLYLVQSGPVPGRPVPRPGNALFRNVGAGRFVEVTNRAGVGDTAYGMGCAAADIDNDGDVDLYVTNFGPNVLYRNNGDGTFQDVTATAGVGNPLWSASAAFADYDQDGLVDLYVTNYVDFRMDNNKLCGDHARRIRAYCHPDAYDGVPDALYRNLGGGQFVDVAAEAGLVRRHGKGLGVVWSDLDRDGDPDLYVANDSVPNALYRNEGGGRFTDVSLISGAAYSEDGRPEAGMGVDAGDFNGDGLMDLVVTNLSGEVNEVYQNVDGLHFLVITYPSGFGDVSLPLVGFGTNFFDFDNDRDQDILVVNGHIIDNISLFNDAYSFAQRNLLFENDGNGRLREIGRYPDSPFLEEHVSRGLAVGDVDGDGDLDAAINNSDARATLLRNEVGQQRSSIRLQVRDPHRSTDPAGTWAEVEAGGRTEVEELRSGTAYCSQNEAVLHLGLGISSEADRLMVRWPSGRRGVWRRVPAGRVYVISEP